MKFLILLFLLHTLTHATSPTPRPSPPPNSCLSAPDPGPCTESLTRYHYDFTTNSCVSFIWGGCDGAVPFDTLEQCEAAQCGITRCDQTPDPGPCRGAVPAYFFNATSQMCEMFTYGGCDGVVPFGTLRRCMRQCLSDPCQLTPRSGPCGERIESYFFNATTNQCESFTYSGCRGLVPFETRLDCRQTCKIQPRRSSRCTRKPDPGPCRSFSLRYFFNSETKRCESFTYGGCQGNVPFETIADCRNAQCNPGRTPGVTATEADDDFDISAEPGPRITNSPSM